jgi:hypothetical protein
MLGHSRYKDLRHLKTKWFGPSSHSEIHVVFETMLFELQCPEVVFMTRQSDFSKLICKGTRVLLTHFHVVRT